MQHRVLIQRAPLWRVGEREADAVARRDALGDLPANQRYLNDFAGRVISVLPMERDFHAGDLREGSREVIVMTLTEKDRVALARRTSKLVGGMIVPVTFDDRWGAVAIQMAERHVDPEAFEREEAEAVKAADAANRAEEKRYQLETAAYQAELDEYARDIARGQEPEEPSDAPSSPVHVERRDLFQEQAVALRRALPRTVVHSGAGLYEVGPAKTYATIQSALDQLWADQGSAAFLANQYIRAFADTYSEYLNPNISLNPDETNCKTLIMEGDSGDSRDNIILTGNGSDYLLLSAMDHFVLRHMRLNAVNYTGCGVLIQNNTSPVELSDLHVVNPSLNKAFLEARLAVRILDCDFDCTGITGNRVIEARTTCQLIRCKIKDASSVACIYGSAVSMYMEACTIHKSTGGARVIRIASPELRLTILNCTFYKGGKAIEFSSSALGRRLTVINCIFKDVDTIFYGGQIPEETSDHIGPAYTLRNNIYDGYINFAYAGGANRTLAQFELYDRVDPAGTIEADPLLTDPDNDDFSLGLGSPAENAGHGSGVPYDVAGDALDPCNPDIGAVTTGALVAPTTPTMPTDLAVVDAEDGDKLVATATVDAGDTLRFYYRKVSSTGWIGYVERSGTGSKDITGLNVNTEYIVVAVAKDGVYFSAPTDPVREWVTTGTSATFNMVRSALDQALNAFQATHVAWPNTEYSPTVGTPFLRPTFMPAEPEQADLGDAGQNRLVGVYQVSVFHPTGTGAGAAETKAEEVITAFKRGNVFTTGGVTVRVEKSWRGPAIQEKDWYHVPVTVRWFAYTAN